MKKLLMIVFLSGYSSVTPQDRAVIYELKAKVFAADCKAYEFDLSANLVSEVPAMTEACQH